MGKPPAPLRNRVAVVACLLLIPLSVWCLQLANEARFVSRLLRHLLGPRQRAGTTSFPDYGEWDLVTMLLMLGVCGAASLCLVWQVARRIGGSGAKEPV